MLVHVFSNTLLNLFLFLQDYNDEIRQEQMWEMHVLNRSSSPNPSNHSNKNGDLAFSNSGSASGGSGGGNGGIFEKSAGELLSSGGIMTLPVASIQGCSSGLSKSSNNGIVINNNNLSNYATSSSNGSLTPPELPNSVSPTPVMMSHPAMRGLKTKSAGLTSPPLSGKNI